MGKKKNVNIDGAKNNSKEKVEQIKGKEPLLISVGQSNLRERTEKYREEKNLRECLWDN